MYTQTQSSYKTAPAKMNQTEWVELLKQHMIANLQRRIDTLTTYTTHNAFGIYSEAENNIRRQRWQLVTQKNDIFCMSEEEFIKFYTRRVNTQSARLSEARRAAHVAAVKRAYSIPQ
jgi:hypothetical protein